MKTHASIWVAAALAASVGVASAADLSLTNTGATTAPVTTPTGSPASTGPTLPYGASEVLRMYQGGINKDVLISYVDGSIASFHLTADSIIYLQHVGLPQEVVSAMLHRDGEMQRRMADAYQQQPQPPQQQAYQGSPSYYPQTPVAQPATPAPQVQVDPYQQQQVVVAPQVVVPDYSVGYPYYYNPVIVGGGIGWGWGFGGPYWGHGGWYGGGWHGGGGFRGGVGFGGGGFHAGGGFHGGGGHR